MVAADTITTPIPILAITDHLHLRLCLMSFPMGVEARMDMVIVVGMVDTVVMVDMGLGEGEEVIMVMAVEEEVVAEVAEEAVGKVTEED